MGGVSGAAVGVADGNLVGGLVAGMIGAIIGTLVGASLRVYLAGALGSDRPAAFVEDLIAIASAAEGAISSRQWTWFSGLSLGQGDTKSLQARPLIPLEEVLCDMRADEQIVLVKGRPPIRCGRTIYFRRPELRSVVGQNRFVRTL
jgi:hypothetical protein